MNRTQENIHKWLIENREQAIIFLQDLVKLPSIQGNEGLIQSVIATNFLQMGLEVHMWELDGKDLKKHPYFFSTRDSFVESPNVIGILKGKGNGKSLILNGHVDVVPAGDLSQWENHPYLGVVQDGKMYGRGTSDMKGGNLSSYLAVKAIKELGIQLKGDVILQSVVEEESGGAGTLAAVMKGFTADAAIIPEPTNMKIFPKQQGSKWFRIRVKGRSAHGGTRYHGVSAIEKSAIVVKHIEGLETVRNQRINDPLYANIPIPVPINIGTIKGGDWPSSVADLVLLEGRIGIAPNEIIEDVQREFKEWLKKLENIDPWFKEHPVELEWFGAQWVPGCIDENHPLMAILKAKYKEVVGFDAVIEASPWGTDGGLLTQVGKTPSIVFGPGISSKAHFPNEYIELDDIFLTAEIIALTIIDWCQIAKIKKR
ncbi:acetylornithine deacetylase [Anaerobacillus alkalilacustris]|uniref:Acetylornithine deacetylase n=1 Tax=Anaerobacillus alkalilacustris TaxID=393763 RepID=A0A1S2LEY5_9BACI|nr:peptidase [Anaerobacillus alkalilacustris]OIJ11068.1 acetylornithine deacetylase [Anaerobacillus alkalilacustris]